MSSFDLSNYKTVSERIAEARVLYPEGRFQSEVIELPEAFADKFVAVRATFYRTSDDPTPAMGLAWEPTPGKTPYTKDSELMNAETSAWGRALVAAFAVDPAKGIASREEVQNRQPSRPKVPDQSVKELMDPAFSEADFAESLSKATKRRSQPTTSHKTAPVTDDNMDAAKWANRQKLILLEALGDKESAKRAWVEVLEKLSLTPDDIIPEDAHGSIEAELDLLLAEAVIEEQLPL